MNTLTFFAYSYRLFGLAFRFSVLLLCCWGGFVRRIMGRSPLLAVEGSRTDRRGERNRERRKRKKTEEANERWREERNRRSEDLRGHIDAEGERRLKEAGFLPEESHVGKRRWKDPDTGRAMPGGAALDRVERREERELQEAGWEQ